MKEPLRVWLRLLAVEQRLVEGVERDLDRLRLPLAWYEVLVRLAQGPESGLRMQDLARQALLSESRTTRVVEKMEAAQLLRRQTVAEDQRGRLCVLTDEGRQRLSESQPAFFRSLDRLIGTRLSVPEQRDLAALLEKLLPGDHAP